jgi:hypothetical protein
MLLRPMSNLWGEGRRRMTRDAVLSYWLCCGLQLLLRLGASRGTQPHLGERRVARTPWLAIAEDVVEPNPYLPWPTHADGVGTFDANDFNFPTTIALIIVVQNLSRFQHNAPPAPNGGSR